jgi:hypothetical protein
MRVLDRILGSPRDRFAREVVAELRRRRVPEVTYLPDTFVVRYRKAPDDGDAGEVFLHNVFLECAGANRTERRARIGRLVAGVVDGPPPPQEWAQARGALRPVLRSAQFGLVSVGPARALLSRPALPHLREYVVIDQPAAMAYVTTDELRRWDVDAAEVFATARANLAALDARPVAGPAERPAVLRFVDTGDAYVTSRLLVDGWLAGLRERVGGDPVAFAPERSTLIVAADGSDVLATVFALVEEEYREAVRSLSPQAYTVGPDGRVVPYAAPAGHPAADAARRAGLILAAHEYAAQREWLDQRHEEDGTDVFVAGHDLVERPDGTLFSVTTWSDGVEALLPEVEWVAFTSGDAEPFFVPWPAVVGETDLCPEPDHDPPRHRVRGWPQAATMERLRARAAMP